MFHWIWWCIQNFFATSSLKVIVEKQSVNVLSQCSNVYLIDSFLTIPPNEKLITPSDSVKKTLHVFPLKRPNTSIIKNVKAILCSCVFIIMSAIWKWKRGWGTFVQRQVTEWIFLCCQPIRFQCFPLRCGIISYYKQCKFIML